MAEGWLGERARTQERLRQGFKPPTRFNEAVACCHDVLTTHPPSKSAFGGGYSH